MNSVLNIVGLVVHSRLRELFGRAGSHVLGDFLLGKLPVQRLAVVGGLLRPVVHGVQVQVIPGAVLDNAIQVTELMLMREPVAALRELVDVVLRTGAQLACGTLDRVAEVLLGSIHIGKQNDIAAATLKDDMVLVRGCQLDPGDLFDVGERSPVGTVQQTLNGAQVFVLLKRGVAVGLVIRLCDAVHCITPVSLSVCPYCKSTGQLSQPFFQLF